MSATFTGGVNWGTATTQTLTASLLTTFIEGALIRSIDTGSMADGAKPCFSSTLPPSNPRTRDLWRDVQNQMSRYYDGANWQPQTLGYVMVNSDTVTLAIGTACAWGTTLASVSKGATQLSGGIVGGAMEVIGVGRSGLVRFAGPGPALVTGTCTVGDILVHRGAGVPPAGGALISTLALAGGLTLATWKPGQECAFALFNNGGVAGTVTVLWIR